MALAVELAVNGVGIAGLDPRTALQRVPADWQLEPVALHAITDTRHLPARTKVFIAFLMQRLGDGGAGMRA
ncbi:MAG TPA: hypothetical protein VFS02_20655 [Telluria sp.]|nr:hypothetical protein [Telluria sp.]